MKQTAEEPPGRRDRPLAALGRVKLQRRSTAERIASELRSLILTGDLRAGSPLREADVAQAFEVARNTVREAFRILGRDGLIVYEVHHGVSVKRLSEQDVRDIYRVRFILEVAAVQQAVDLSGRSLQEVLEILDRAGKAREMEDWQELVTLNLRFHQELVGLARSPRLDAMFAALMAELRLGLSLMEDQAVETWLEENRTLFRTLEKRGAAAFARKLDEYLAKSEHALLTVLAEQAEG